MKNLKRILVIVDPTVERDFVIDRLNNILQDNNAEVRFFINSVNTLTPQSYAYEGMDHAFFETQRQLFIEHYSKILDELVAEFEGKGFRVSATFSEAPHLADSIIEQVKEFDPDLVLKSTHHHSVLRRSLITNTDWQLIRKCKKPLLLVKPRDWIESGSVVAAVDPLHVKAQQSRLDHLLVENAIEMAKQLHLTARIFHCYYPFVSSMFPTVSETSQQIKEIRRRHEVAMTDLLASYSIEPGNVSITRGDLIPSLIKFLEKSGANILVIGALSRNVIERAIVGNTAEKILDDCPCDVLVIRS
ncbi:MAG: universal stress protein [Pseudohongiellaceae bacterium]